MISPARAVSGAGKLASATFTQRRGLFYATATGLMLAVVLVGFAPTFYLREAFAAPDLAPRVWMHGAVLTAWFAGLHAQALLVATGRVALHRRLGWLWAAVAVAALITSVYVTLAAVAAHTIMARTVWSNLANALAFLLFVSAAIVARRDGETHKRLMLLGSIAFIQPAVARITRWPIFAEFGGPLVLAVYASLLFVVALVVYDAVSRRRLHRATLIGGALLVALRIVAVFVIGGSAWGSSVLRWFD